MSLLQCRSRDCEASLSAEASWEMRARGVIMVPSQWERQGVLIGGASCTESGVARVMAERLQIYLRCEGDNIKHGTILKGQRDGSEDGIYDCESESESETR